MIFKMTGLYNKSAAVGILLIMLFLLWVFIIRPYFMLWDQRITTVEMLHKKHQSLIALINNSDMFEQQFRAISNNRGLRGIFLAKKPGALAEIKLQGVIKRVINDSGGRVVQSSIKPLPEAANKTSSNYADKTVIVDILMQGDINSIYRTLHKLENYRPVILVRNLEISRQQTHYQYAEDSPVYRAKYDAVAFIQ